MHGVTYAFFVFCKGIFSGVVSESCWKDNVDCVYSHCVLSREHVLKNMHDVIVCV